MLGVPATDSALFYIASLCLIRLGMTVPCPLSFKGGSLRKVTFAVACSGVVRLYARKLVKDAWR